MVLTLIPGTFLYQILEIVVETSYLYEHSSTGDSVDPELPHIGIQDYVT
jgi:hypothetical protein